MLFTDKENFLRAGAASLGMSGPQKQQSDSLGLGMRNKIIERGIIKWFLSLVLPGSVPQRFLSLLKPLSLHT